MGFLFESVIDKSCYNIVIFVEFDIYLIIDWNFVLVGCFEDYSDFGSIFIFKLVLCYSINELLLLCGVISIGFRVLLFV